MLKLTVLSSILKLGPLSIWNLTWLHNHRLMDHCEHMLLTKNQHGFALMGTQHPQLLLASRTRCWGLQHLNYRQGLPLTRVIFKQLKPVNFWYKSRPSASGILEVGKHPDQVSSNDYRQRCCRHNNLNTLAINLTI